MINEPEKTLSTTERPEAVRECRKVYRVKFLGGADAFDPEQLSEAVRAAAGALADPSTPEVTDAEREALRDVFGALGLVRPCDPGTVMGGRTMSHNSPLDY